MTTRKTTQLSLPIAELAPPTPAGDLTIEGMALNGHRLVLQDGGKELERTCTKCHRRQPLRDFGLRQMKSGEIRVQAYCTTCRNEKKG